jgi:hypothetical protein
MFALHIINFFTLHFREMLDFTKVFWIGTIAFILTSVATWIERMRNVGDVGYMFYLQIFAGFLMFVGSKIGRAFLGLE